jgi:glycosyltransferase involved in cell wall biosynthesis
MKILILSKYNRDGASSRYRFYNYREYFQENNIQFDVRPLLDNNYVLNLYAGKKIEVFLQKINSIIRRFFFIALKANNYDLIIIEKELFPNVPYLVEKTLLRNKKYALDFDDYIATAYKINKVKKFFFESKIDKLAQNARFVTVGNHWYFNEIKSKNLIYLPTVIDLKKYPKVKDNYDSKIVTIVWIGSLYTGRYLKIVIPVLQKLSKKYAIRVKIIGVNIDIEGIDFELIQWKENTEVDEILSSDIGIMPLENTIWEKGKCGFKLIQYMACGLPVVATTAPANEEIIDNGVNGFLVDSEEEWYVALEKLITDTVSREKFGKSGRLKIESGYSYQIWGDKYCEFIKNGL